MTNQTAEQIREAAEKTYNTAQTSAAQWAKMGMSPTGIMAATLDEIIDHLTICNEVSQKYGFELDSSKFEIGTTREQLTETAERKAKKHRKGAGYRALKRKYGEESAKNIIDRS